MRFGAYCALVHHPVRDRAGAVVTSAVTNVDVHDLARSARTYGLRSYYVVTPIEAQRAVIDRILAHWDTGAGKARIPERADALALACTVASVEHAIAEISDREGAAPRVVATGARPPAGRTVIAYADERARIGESAPWLVLFGTGHGLAPALVDRADGVLAPIDGVGDYNHLSVRAAAAITMDRLFGRAT